MQKKYESLIFDLDGTLWDACPITAEAWNGKLHELGLEGELTGDDIRSVAGLPQQVCIQTLLPEQMKQNPDLIAELTLSEQAAIKEKGGELFEGVAEGIKDLSKEYNLFIVSNCLEWYLKLFFERFKLKEYFTDWDCVGISGLPKSEMIKNLIEMHQLKSPVYTGDTLGDEEASQGAGIDFIHAEYGFGRAKNPQESFNSFIELAEFFTK
ncbi:HAD family hydrolase [Candidatus Peregrinibacteria bacterium]|jgi:phosphoglycolate phosphatase|nr:HAD family hydrolase [Candidatus Peregrinibacteria bacterium]MBT7736765.1 HAD family hydrolase [Candidatus Peregrinibacteria bacterium]